MIIKTKDFYLNIDHVKRFQIKCSPYTGGISLYADGEEVYGGDAINDLSKCWAGVIIMEFEEAIARGDKFFNLASFLEDDETPFIKTMILKYDEYVKKHSDDEVDE